MKKLAICLLVLSGLALTACNKAEVDVSENTTETTEKIVFNVTESTTEEVTIETDEDINIPDPTPVIISAGVDSYEDYYVSSFKIAEDGLSGDFELREYVKYTKEQIFSLPEKDKRFKGHILKEEDGIIKVYINSEAEADDEFNSYFRLQENGYYYLIEDVVAETNKLGKKTLKISADAKVYNLADPFLTEGIELNDNAIKLDTVKDFLYAYNNYSLLRDPDLFIRIVNDEISVIVVDIDCAEGGCWINCIPFKAQDSSYEDYIVTSADFDMDKLAADMELEEFVKYSVEEVNAFKKGSTFRGEKILNVRKNDDTTAKTVELEFKDDKYIFFTLQENGYYYEGYISEYETKKTSSRTLEIAPDAVMLYSDHVIGSDSRGIFTGNIDDDAYFENPQDMIKYYNERVYEDALKCFIRVENGKITFIQLFSEE